MTPKEVLALIRQREVTNVDLRFMDFPGVWQHFSIPADLLTEETFEDGLIQVSCRIIVGIVCFRPFVVRILNRHKQVQSSGRSPLGAIFTSFGMNSPSTVTKSCCAAMTSRMFL